MAAQPNMHWTDVMYTAKKTRVVDIKDRVQGRINRIYAEQLAKSEAMRP